MESEKHWNAETMEYWNVGFLSFIFYPLFHYSSIPIFQFICYVFIRVPIKAVKGEEGGGEWLFFGG